MGTIGILQEKDAKIAELLLENEKLAMKVSNLKFNKVGNPAIHNN